jgi:DNA polymerase-4
VRGVEARSAGEGAGPLVLHADADAFFVACHRAEDPSLRGRAVVVAGDPRARHGVVLSASYEARARGVRGAMALVRALALAPDLVVVAPDRALYARYGRRLGEVFDAFSPRVERLSIDEAWLDMTGGLDPWGGDPAALARALQRRVREHVGVTVSVGVARTKYLAKQASDLDKPEGVTLLLDAEAVRRRLWPLPAGALFGCGPRAAARLARLGLTTVGDVARADPARLAPVFGAAAARMVARARGEDPTPVLPAEAVRAVGAERTLARDAVRDEEVGPVLLALAEEVAARLRDRSLEGRRVVLKYRTAAFRTHTHQRTLARPTAHGPEIYRAARELFGGRSDTAPVRLVGVRVTDLGPRAGQLLLGAGARPLALDAALDAVRRRWGERALVRARALVGGPRP